MTVRRVDFSPAAPPPGCDALEFGEWPSVLDGRCRCMACARCGHHSTSTHQGHYGAWCSVTGTSREAHFCCKDPAFGCEMETAPAAPESCTWCQAQGDLSSFGGLPFCDEECADDFRAEWGDGD